LLFALLERLSPLLQEPGLLTQAGHLYFGREGFGLGRERLSTNFLLLLLQPVVFGLRAGQVILTPGPVALFAAFIPGRDDAQNASRRIGRTRPYGNETFRKKEVG
jgi:hypothetical protein